MSSVQANLLAVASRNARSPALAPDGRGGPQGGRGPMRAPNNWIPMSSHHNPGRGGGGSAPATPPPSGRGSGAIVLARAPQRIFVPFAPIRAPADGFAVGGRDETLTQDEAELDLDASGDISPESQARLRPHVYDMITGATMKRNVMNLSNFVVPSQFAFLPTLRTPMAHRGLPAFSLACEIVGYAVQASVSDTALGVPRYTVIPLINSAGVETFKSFTNPNPAITYAKLREPGQANKTFATVGFAVRPLWSLYEDHEIGAREAAMAEWYRTTNHVMKVPGRNGAPDQHLFVIYIKTPAFQDARDLVERDIRFQQAVRRKQKPIVVFSNLVVGWTAALSQNCIQSLASTVGMDHAWGTHTYYIGNFRDLQQANPAEFMSQGTLAFSQQEEEQRRQQQQQQQDAATPPRRIHAGALAARLEGAGGGFGSGGVGSNLSSSSTGRRVTTRTDEDQQRLTADPLPVVTHDVPVLQNAQRAAAVTVEDLDDDEAPPATKRSRVMSESGVLERSREDDDNTEGTDEWGEAGSTTKKARKE